MLSSIDFLFAGEQMTSTRWASADNGGKHDQHHGGQHHGDHHGGHQHHGDPGPCDINHTGWECLSLVDACERHLGIGTKNESEKIPGIQISRAWHLDFKAKNTRYFSVPISRYFILSCPTLSDLFNVNLNAFCMFITQQYEFDKFGFGQWGSDYI